MDNSARPAALLGAGRWGARRIDPSQLPFDRASDTDAQTPTTPPPVMPPEFDADPELPDFQLIDKTWREMDLQDGNELAVHRREKATAEYEYQRSVFSEWWFATYAMLVCHAATRAGRGGSVWDLSNAFKRGELKPLSSKATSPHEDTLKDRLQFLQQGLAVSMPITRQHVVERSALLIDNLAHALPEHRLNPLARRLRDVCYELFAMPLDANDRTAVAVALQRLVTSVDDVCQVEDLMTIAQAYMGAYELEETAAAPAALDAMQVLIELMPRSPRMADLAGHLLDSLEPLSEETAPEPLRIRARARRAELTKRFPGKVRTVGLHLRAAKGFGGSPVVMGPRMPAGK